MNRPPKNMTSVTRNTHIPSVDASSCWSMLWKWCWSRGCPSAPWPGATPLRAGCVDCPASAAPGEVEGPGLSEVEGSAMVHLARRLVVVGRLGHDHVLIEIE